MELKFGLTLWTKQNRPPPRYPALRKNLRCDVAIIGAGITGALVAHALVSAGLRVVIVDKRPAATGSTSASTALLLFETDTALADLARWHGPAAAARTYALGHRAIREIGHIARRLHLDCGFTSRNSLYLASDRRGLAQLRREYTLRRRARLPGALLTRAQLHERFGLHFAGALYSPGCAQFDAVAFTRQLLAHHHRTGRLRIFQHTRIASLHPPVTHLSASATPSDPKRIQLKTTTGCHISARHVIVATGYEAAPFLTDERVKLHSSYVVASEPLPATPLWRDECRMWETARPYFYLRTTADHRIVIGGEDEPFADPARRDAKLPAKARHLRARFQKLFPHLPFVPAFSWTGTFVESPDGLPYIGPREPGSPIFYALGYGGNGITFSQIAAKILTRLCQGRPHPDAPLFRFNR